MPSDDPELLNGSGAVREPVSERSPLLKKTTVSNDEALPAPRAPPPAANGGSLGGPAEHKKIVVSRSRAMAISVSLAMLILLQSENNPVQLLLLSNHHNSPFTRSPAMVHRILNSRSVPIQKLNAAQFDVWLEFVWTFFLIYVSY